MNFFEFLSLDIELISQSRDFFKHICLRSAFCRRNDLHHAACTFCDVAHVSIACRQNVLVNHVEHCVSLDVKHFRVFFELNFVVAVHLAFAVNAVFCEHLDILLVEVAFHCIRQSSEVQKTAFFSLFNPFVIVAVSVEDDFLVLNDFFLDEFLQFSVQVRRFFETVCKFIKSLSDDCVQDDIRARD